LVKDWFGSTKGVHTRGKVLQKRVEPRECKNLNDFLLLSHISSLSHVPINMCEWLETIGIILESHCDWYGRPQDRRSAAPTSAKRKIPLMNALTASYRQETEWSPGTISVPM
jgi:hypothetical protein